MVKALLRLFLLFWCLVFSSATPKDKNCQVDEKSENDADSCQAFDDDSSSPRVVRQGMKLMDDARFPFVLEGDWKNVLAVPEIRVMVESGSVAWTEGPLVRHPKNTKSAVLYLSDTIRALIYRLSLPEHDNVRPKFEVWATHAGGIDPTLDNYANNAEPGSNGMATDGLDPDFVVINQHGLRRVIRCRLDDHPIGEPLSKCPNLQVLADSYPATNNIDEDSSRAQTIEAKRFNSPNDVVVDNRDHSIWFTDPIYGLLEKDRFCDEFNCNTGASYLDQKSELSWQGVYRIDRTTKAVELVTKHHRRPNGLAVAGDTLWVADSTIGSPSWTAYSTKYNPKKGGSTIASKASLVLNPSTLGRTLGHVDGLPPLTGGEGLSDGFKIDESGYIWASIPNGLAVIDPNNRKVICQILLGVNTSNLAFGRNGDVWITGKDGVWKMTRKIGIRP